MAIADVLVEGRLPGCYIDEITRRKNRFMGAWTGTSGSLAADCHWLLVERSQILEELQVMQELQEANAKLRQAVEARVGGGCCEGGKCHPTSIDTQGPLLDPDQVIAEDDERTADSPFEAVSVMSQSQMEAAWAGVRSRVQGMQHRVQEFAAAAEKPAEAPLPPPTGKIVDGDRTRFATGAVRSSDAEETRYDLISPIGLEAVARTCAEGAARYSPHNWERGMDVPDLLNHALRHIYQFLAGDRSEPHLPHAAWGLLAAIHSDTLWPDLNKDKLRGPGCTPPYEPPI